PGAPLCHERSDGAESPRGHSGGNSMIALFSVKKVRDICSGRQMVEKHRDGFGLVRVTGQGRRLQKRTLRIEQIKPMPPDPPSVLLEHRTVEPSRRPGILQILELVQLQSVLYASDKKALQPERDHRQT